MLGLRKNSINEHEPDLVDDSGCFLPLLDVDDPTTTELVGFVFPQWLDTSFEKGIVTAGTEFRHLLDVVVH